MDINTEFNIIKGMYLSKLHENYKDFRQYRRELSDLYVQYNSVANEWVLNQLKNGGMVPEAILSEIDSKFSVEKLMESYSLYKAAYLKEKDKVVKAGTTSEFTSGDVPRWKSTVSVTLADYGMTDAEYMIAQSVAKDDDWKKLPRVVTSDPTFNPFSDCEYMDRECSKHEKPHLGGER